MEAGKLAAGGFPRCVRLTRGVEFQRVFQHGKRLHANGLNARAAANSLGFPRLGMAIAKKALRRAHERNRIRRLIRESFRQHLSQLPAVDLVVMCRSDVLTMSNSELFQQLEGLWLRLHKLYSAGSGQTQDPALP
ncbi:MAG TPA: ribonuclease P protein component [Candidatus Thiothrix moscowensis]|uniref:ribonuclease P protein component n=1 Tax=unclassified Thiothrix TaxID=2636184 RepID=UPI0025ED9AC5|nr:MULTISPECIES: ribonuclease P protein component [unclassified Thiothrix]HRJ51926.1 ribonuclease P protein component [Candidatus Thiothrix moscowensis]HRJ92241.1 ribonuclease P protein component [Candidatus Thiothrix moscowensis]